MDYQGEVREAEPEDVDGRLERAEKMLRDLTARESRIPSPRARETTGVGRTGLMSGLLLRALQNGRRGVFMRAQDLFDEMYASLVFRRTPDAARVRGFGGEINPHRLRLAPSRFGHRLSLPPGSRQSCANNAPCALGE